MAKVKSKSVTLQAAAATNEPAKPKKKPKPGSKAAQVQATQSNVKNGSGAAALDGLEAKKQPTKREIVAGSSWTGKLPVTLLHEHAAKQKWRNPDYDLRKASGNLFAPAKVFLRRKDPKSSDVETVVFAIPRSLLDNEDIPAASKTEAQNFAATYALFRLCSAKNLRMVLPPRHRDLWMRLEEAKKADIAAGKQFLYEPDPFALAAATKAAKELREEKVHSAKLRAEKQSLTEKYVEKAPSILHCSRTVDDNSRITAAAWHSAPILAMSDRWRSRLQQLIRSFGGWSLLNNAKHADQQESTDIVRCELEQFKLQDDCNFRAPKATSNGSAERRQSNIANALAATGFRHTHIEEALSFTDTYEAALEWLLVFVPEDDLPEKFLPTNFSEGIIIQNMTESEGKIMDSLEFLKESGYPKAVMRSAVVLFISEPLPRRNYLALEFLQITSLLDQSAEDIPPYDPVLEKYNLDRFKEDVAALESIVPQEINTRNEGEVICRFFCEEFSSTFSVFYGCPRLGEYPNALVTMMISSKPKIPAYIRLQIIKLTLDFLKESRHENLVMASFFNLKEIIAELAKHPMRLTDLYPKTSKNNVVLSPKAQLGKSASTRDTSKISFLDITGPFGHECSGKILRDRSRLPAWFAREDIIDITNASISLIKGETGCGKSTQVIQFIRDHCKHTRILCTQPRRISAIGLAERVAFERSTKISREVGYQIRGDNKISDETRIVFCTIGILLRQFHFHGEKAFEQYSHIILDEVHERSAEIDMLLGLLKSFKRLLNSGLHIVLMSATIEIQSFLKYFGEIPMLSISGRTFPVREYYVDELYEQLGQFRNRNFKQISKNEPKDQAMYRLIAQTIEMLDQQLPQDESILVFLSGISEINRCISEAQRLVPNLVYCRLHSSLPPREQRKVFQKFSDRKVVVSTNIAETSITIEDVTAVIDSGKVKELSYDPETDTTYFRQVWASRSACAQRAGRAGRVRPGVCYKLFSRVTAEVEMSAQTKPELLRIPLQQVCLNVLAIGLDPKKFLTSLISPPAVEVIESAVQRLIEIGAVEKHGGMTMLGKYLALLPADLRCAKLLVYAMAFGLEEYVLSMTAVFSNRSPFLSDQNADERRREYSEGHGDFIGDTNAYEAWRALVQKQQHKNASEISKWCANNGLSMNTLRDIEDTRKDLKQALINAGLWPAQNDGGSYEQDDVRYGRSECSGTDTTTEAESIGSISKASSSGSIESGKIGRMNGRFSLHQHRKMSIGDIKIVQSLIAAAFGPNFASVKYPRKKFTQGIAGAVEKDAEANTIKFYSDNKRIFLHPSSVCFRYTGSELSAPFITFFRKMETSKLYVFQASPTSVYAMLFFATEFEIAQNGLGVELSSGMLIRSWPKLAIIARLLRRELFRLLQQKFENPLLDIKQSEAVKAIKELIISEGRDVLSY